MENSDLLKGLSPEVQTFLGGRVVLGSEKGPNHTENEDCAVVIQTDNGLVMAVIDGMGGEGFGNVASLCVKQAIEDGVQNHWSFADIQQRASNLIMEKTRYRRPGAAYVAAAIGSNHLTVNMAGDCRCVVVSNDGALVSATQDEGKFNQLSNCVSGSHPGRTTRAIDNLFLNPGDVVLLLSDGITDNAVAEKPYFQVVDDYAFLQENLGDGDWSDFFEERAQIENEAIRRMIELGKGDIKRTVQEMMRSAQINMYQTGGKPDDRTVVAYVHE